MSEKRKRDRGEEATQHSSDHKRHRKGFKVGPDNLPDGVYKRKNQKIKQGLIDKAKIKKEYAKLRKQGNIPEQDETIPQPASLAVDEPQEEANTEPHPDRQNLIEKEAEHPEEAESGGQYEPRPRKRKPKAVPFKKEYDEAQQRKAEAEARRQAREEAARERHRKIEERERFRRAMAKARTGGKNGQRKLGRESKVLLDRVRRMVGDDGQ